MFDLGERFCQCGRVHNEADCGEAGNIGAVNARAAPLATNHSLAARDDWTRRSHAVGPWNFTFWPMFRYTPLAVAIDQADRNGKAAIPGLPRSSKALLRQPAALPRAPKLRVDLEDESTGPGTHAKDRNKDVGKSTLVALLAHEAVQYRMQKHLNEAVFYLHKAIPHDSQMVDFTLRAFGLPSREVELTTGSVESNNVHVHNMGRLVTG